jgi:polyhydroxyalkanoate synthesis regulator phasin
MASNYEARGAYAADTPARAHRFDHEHPDRVIRRISPWAVLAGAIVGVVVLFLLSLFGVGVGLATINPAPGGSGTPEAGTLGMGSAIWGVISFLIALFAGGWIAGRLAGDPKKLDGMLHGVVAWALTTLLLMWLTAAAVSGIIGGAFSLAGTVASTTLQGAQSAASGQSGDALTNVVQQAVPWEQIQQRVEQALPAEVDIDRQTLMAAFRQFVAGGGDRQAVIDVLVAQGGMSQEEAESTLQNLETEYEQAVQEAEQQAARTAEAAAGAASSAALWSFIALLIGGAAAAAGGWLGAPRDELVAGTEMR